MATRSNTTRSMTTQSMTTRSMTVTTPMTTPSTALTPGNRRSAGRRGGTVLLALLICLGFMAGAWLPGSLPAAAAEVDVTFDRAPVHEVLRILAQAEGVNIIVDQGVTGEVSISAQGMDAREAIQLVAAVRGLHVEQIDNTLLVSATPTGLGGRIGQAPVSRMNFTQRPVREVIQAIAERAGWNLIAEPPLNEEITAWLEGVEPVEALRLVAGAAGLNYQLVDRVLHIKAASTRPLARTAVHRLDHVDPEKGKELVEAFFPDVPVDVDVKTRSLVVKAPEPQLEDVEAFIQSVDTPRPQVLVEARILDVEVNALRALGVEWFGERGEVSFSAAWRPSPFVFEWDPVSLQATLQVLEEHGYSQVLASPKISAVDREEARILVGERVPVVTEFTDPDGFIHEEVQYHEVGIGLRIQPTIAADGSATLHIHTEVSAVVDPEEDYPRFRTREATSVVRVYDGQPLIIGGLIEEEERQAMEGIPFLRDLPIVGALFSRRTTANVQKETIIVLVPHIVNPEAVVAGGFGSDPTTTQARAAGGSPADGPPGTGQAEAAQAGSRIEETREMIRNLGRSVMARSARPSDALTLSLDLTSLPNRAAEVQLEREQGRTSLVTRVYTSTGRSSGAWSLGAGFRYYIGEPGGTFRPWIEAGADYAWPLRNNPLLVYNAGAGLRLTIGGRGLLELYGRYQHPGREGGLDGLPGRTNKDSLGVRLGWQY